MASLGLSNDGRRRILADGNEIPLLGLGVWQVPDGPGCENAVGWALEAGYRHIDTAQGYGNERSVGRAVAASGIPAEEIFITTKFSPNGEDPVREAEQSLARLGVDRIDLYVIHWPGGGPTWAWPGMEAARERGLARSIGVSNFAVSELDDLASVATVSPAVNQVEFSPPRFRRGLLDECERRRIAVEAYSPLGTGEHLNDKVVAGIAERLERTPAQVLLRWGIERNLVVLAKSVHRERIVENARVFDFSLPPEDMVALDGLDRTGGTEEARDQKWW